MARQLARATELDTCLDEIGHSVKKPYGSSLEGGRP